MNFKNWLLITEAKKSSDIAKELLGNDDDLFKKIKSIIPTDIPEKLQGQLLPIAAFYYKQEPNLNTLKQEIKDYASLVKLNKIDKIVTIKDDLTVDGDFKSYIYWTRIIHAKKHEDIVFKPSINYNLNDEELNDLYQPIAKSKDGKIKVYLADSVNHCIVLGKGEVFCISQPSNLQYQKYRDDDDFSTFYFVYDNTRTDALAKAVVDVKKFGDFELTDRKNETAETMQDPYVTDREKRIDSNPDLYFKYLKEKGISKIIFKSKPRTKQEKEEHKKLGEKNHDLDWFMSLNPEEQSKYIGKGHILSDQQFDFIFDNNLKLLLVQYVRIGNHINDYQFEKIARDKNLLAKYLYNRIIKVSVDFKNNRDDYNFSEEFELDQYLHDHDNNGIYDFISMIEYKYFSQKNKKDFYDMFEKDKLIIKVAIRFNDIYFIESMLETNPKIIKFFLKNFNYKMNIEGNNLVEKLLKKDPDLTSAIIQGAAQFGNIYIVKSLFEPYFEKFKVISSIDFKERTAQDWKYLKEYSKMTMKILEKSAKGGRLDITEYMINDKKVNDISDNTVEYAVIGKNIDLVEYLINKGVKINFNCLATALETNQLDIAKLLIAKGAVIGGNAIAAADTPEKELLLKTYQAQQRNNQ